MTEDVTFYVQLGFRQEAGNRQETGICFSAAPTQSDSIASYGATVESSGAWVEGGITYCGVSPREIVIGWELAAAKELRLPQLTLIGLETYRGSIPDIRAAFGHLFKWALPCRPILEIDSSAGPEVTSSVEIISEWVKKLKLSPSVRENN